MRHAAVAHGIAIQAVAGDGRSEMGGVHTNLMGAPRFDCKLHQGDSAMTRKDCPMRDGGLPVVVYHRHSLRIKRLAPDQRIQCTLLRLGRSVQNREIRLLHASVAFEFASQRKICPLRAGEYHNPTGVTIETVHHAGPLHAANPRHVRKILEKNVAKRSIRIAGRTMHYDACRFIDGDYVVIGMDYLHEAVAAGFHLLLW